MTVSHQTILVSGYLQNSFRPLASKHSSLSCTELAVWWVHNKKNEVLKCNFLQFLKTDFSINAHFFIIHTTLFLQKIQAAKSHECEHAYHCQNQSRRLITPQSLPKDHKIFFNQSINLFQQLLLLLHNNYFKTIFFTISTTQHLSNLHFCHHCEKSACLFLLQLSTMVRLGGEVTKVTKVQNEASECGLWCWRQNLYVLSPFFSHCQPHFRAHDLLWPSSRLTVT